MVHPIAKQYASALFELAQQKKVFKSVEADLRHIVDLLNRSDELSHFISNPVIPLVARLNVFEKVFQRNVDSLTYIFLQLLAEKKRLDVLPSIVSSFEKLSLTFHNILNVRIISHIELNKIQQKEITDQLKKRFEKEITADWEVDKTLLGGIKIKSGDQVFDYSISNQLERFKASVINA